MDELRRHGLDYLVDSLPCKFTKRGAVHDTVFNLLQCMQESGGIAEQVHTWEGGWAGGRVRAGGCLRFIC